MATFKYRDAVVWNWRKTLNTILQQCVKLFPIFEMTVHIRLTK